MQPQFLLPVFLFLPLLLSLSLSFFLRFLILFSFLHSLFPHLHFFSFYCVPRLSFSPFPYLSFLNFFSFSFFPYDRVSLYFFLTLSLALRGRYWGLRLRLSRGQRDRIVFRTIWLIECRWLEISLSARRPHAAGCNYAHLK